MEDSIDAFIRFLAVERGLSENYQLSTQRSLTEFAQWCGAKKKITHPRSVTLPVMSEYLAERKRAGLSASSIKLVVVALKIFFRFLAAKGIIERDPAEALALPRIERYLPETLNELQVEQFLEKIDTKAASWFTRPGDDRAALRKRAAHFGAGKCATGGFQFRTAYRARDWQRKQDPSGARRPKSMRSPGSISLCRATKTGEAAH